MSRPSPILRSPVARRGGFTLLELMISIALVLILILGVNVVFSMTAQTVGAGNALSGAYRANQSMSGVINQDLKAMRVGTDVPAFVITGETMTAWRNAAEREADADGEVHTVDLNDDGDVNDPGEDPAASRVHRIDQLAFFARGKFYKQTGTGTRFWDADTTNPGRPASSDEAWIWYGHVKQPTNAPTTYRLPGEGTPQDNPYNYFATQWILGRVPMLLLEHHTAGRVETGTGLAPLSFIDGQTTDRNTFDVFRFDVAQISMKDYRDRVYSTNQHYWNHFCLPYNSTPPRRARFVASPFLPRPITPEGVAAAVPAFVPGCTSFIVEYAGDFIAQNPIDGQPTSGEPDGVIDFVVTGTGANAVRKTRWYGLARDVDGNGVADVLPLRVFAKRFEQAFVWEREAADSPRYVAAWGADETTLHSPRPTMLRITITVDDSRMAGGETFEFVGAVR